MNANSHANSHIWTLTPTDVYKTLTTTPQGISEAEANLRLKQSGYNELPEPQTRPLILRFIDQLTHFIPLLSLPGENNRRKTPKVFQGV
ncbi:cation-transporting P-type ATPase [Nostoc cycadae]|uniref:HAD family hydrolase n=1 Tax=Nostoc cycadae WK-1 TaxID=1861711 RepID=A0A2H6LCA7_9NOSO|nr:cation-transporting P-type ATPase [Nostoc cycadae]GBE90861.1 HAD family hydrolase [Nostoc cycadae WK-1]